MRKQKEEEERHDEGHVVVYLNVNSSTRHTQHLLTHFTLDQIKLQLRRRVGSEPGLLESLEVLIWSRSLTGGELRDDF